MSSPSESPITNKSNKKSLSKKKSFTKSIAIQTHKVKSLLATSLKANRDFYQSTASSTGIVSGLVLSGVIQTIIQAVLNNFKVNEDGGTYSFENPRGSLYFGETLYAIGVLEGLSLFFGNILMLMPENQERRFSKKIQHLWRISFIMMLVLCYGGIFLLLTIPLRYGESRPYVSSVLIPTAVLIFMIAYLIFSKLRFDLKQIQSDAPSIKKEGNDSAKIVASI